MNSIQHNRAKSINDIISIVKLSSLFFCAIIFYSEFFVKGKIVTIDKNSYFNMTAFSMLFAIILLLYSIWSMLSNDRIRTKNSNGINIIENMMFILIFTFLIIKSDSYASQYKFLFLFITIASTLQLGMIYGMTISIISSIIILTIDLVFAPNVPYNAYFQNDLILVGVFILTAWPLGYYVKIEKENIKQKNIELQKLNKELNKKDKQRKYMEEILLKNEACYSLIIQDSMDAILIHRNDKLIFANGSAGKLMGFESIEEISGYSFLDFIPSYDKESTKNKFTKVYEEKAPRLVFESNILKKNGEIVIVKNTSTYFIYEGRPTILSILHDITSEKQVEKLEKDVKKNIELLNETREFNRFITEFFSNISHELKTPLNVIFGAVQVLGIYKQIDEEYIERQDKYLKVMKQNCYRLMRLINNLLDMTRADSGFMKLDAHNYDVVRVVEDVALSIASYVEDKGISLVFDTDVEEKVIAFDPYKIERILLNLLSNAIKFTSPGGEIFVNMMDMQDKIVISVKDTGVGIPEDKLQIIFERFGQVDKTLSRNREGTGIGLSLVKSFVEMHGGKIYAKSKVNIGSEFVIELPVSYISGEVKEESFMIETNIERINIEFSDIYN